MPLVPVPKPTFVQKLKRFFMIDLLKGMNVTLRFNLGALTDKDAVAGKGIYTEQYPKVRAEVAPRFHGAVEHGPLRRYHPPDRAGQDRNHRHIRAGRAAGRPLHQI